MSAEEAAFRVVYSVKIQEKLKDILQRAKKTGKLTHFVNGVLEMDRRLHADPLGLGELVGTLRWKKMPVHVGFIRPLKVDFAIHEEEKFVFVRNIQEVTSLDI